MLSISKWALPLLLMTCAAVAPSMSFAAGNRFVLVCKTDGLYAPDGQPILTEWGIDLHGNQACWLPDCSVPATIERATDSDIWIKIQHPGGSPQLFKVNRKTGEFTWTPGVEYHGTCREGTSARWNW